MTNKEQLGRLALRVEGHWWVAYFAPPHTMDDALELGRIAFSLVQDEGMKNNFIELMRDALAQMIENVSGERPSWPDGIVAAPEHERAGRVYRNCLHLQKSCFRLQQIHSRNPS